MPELTHIGYESEGSSTPCKLARVRFAAISESPLETWTPLAVPSSRAASSWRTQNNRFQRRPTRGNAALRPAEAAVTEQVPAGRLQRQQPSRARHREPQLSHVLIARLPGLRETAIARPAAPVMFESPARRVPTSSSRSRRSDSRAGERGQILGIGRVHRPGPRCHAAGSGAVLGALRVREFMQAWRAVDRESGTVRRARSRRRWGGYAGTSPW